MSGGGGNIVQPYPPPPSLSPYVRHCKGGKCFSIFRGEALNNKLRRRGLEILVKKMEVSSTKTIGSILDG